MMEYTLNIGDVVTSNRKANYTCLGLGSCIGLFIQDRVTGLSGGAHIFLPENEKGPAEFAKYYNVTSAIDEILRQLKSNGSTLTGLRAKVTGGANMMETGNQTGIRIAQSVVNHLISNKIFIAALDVGGNYSRTAKFNSETGSLLVRKPAINEHKIY